MLIVAHLPLWVNSFGAHTTLDSTYEKYIVLNMHIEAIALPDDINLYPDGLSIFPKDITVEEFVECFELEVESHPNQTADNGLQFCYKDDCGSNLVHPVVWQELGHDEWRACLRCPECETYSVGDFSQDALDELDLELSDNQYILLRRLRQLMHNRFDEEIDVFVEALEADHILPEDF